jgi:hypothetical protein
MLVNISKKSRLFIVVISFVTLLFLTNLSTLQAEKPIVYGPNEKPYGKTYEEYANIFWNANSNLEPTMAASSASYIPQKCFLMELDNKYFLQDFYAETPSNRDRSFECTISQKPIVIPALIEGCSYGDYELPKRNDQTLLDCAKSRNPYAIVEVIIDGEQIKNINDYRKLSDFFILNETRPNNAYNTEIGSWRAITDAIMVVVDLPVGEHDIRYKVTQKIPETIVPNDPVLITDVKYHFIVNPN